MTVGPWKPVALEAYNNKIVELDIRADISESLGVNLSVDITFSEKKLGFATFILKGLDGAIETSSTSIPTDPGHAKASFSFQPGELKLWYPVGYGEQPLYTALVELADEVRRSHVPPFFMQQRSNTTPNRAVMSLI